MNAAIKCKYKFPSNNINNKNIITWHLNIGYYIFNTSPLWGRQLPYALIERYGSAGSCRANKSMRLSAHDFLLTLPAINTGHVAIVYSESVSNYSRSIFAVTIGCHASIVPMLSREVDKILEGVWVVLKQP